MPRVLVACAFCFVLAVNAASEPNWGTWTEEVRKQHPLAGSIYRTYRTARSRPSMVLDGRVQTDVLPLGELYRPIPPSGPGLSIPAIPPVIVLLGEVHDNPAHHQVRAWMVKNSPRTFRPWRPAVVFEQIRVDQQPALDQFKALADAGGGPTVDDLFRLLEWDKSGWPPAQTYKPLFEAAIAAKLAIIAGDPPRDRVRAVARNGFSVVPPEERTRLGLDSPMPPALVDTLRKDLADSHCGVLSAEAVDGMVTAQRYRDAHLADALLAAAAQHGSAVLIAGNGHVRADRGVPWHLRRRGTTTVASYLLVEVEEGKTDPEAYMPRDPEGKPAADLLIFTPKHPRPDPCDQFRRSKR